MSHVAGSKVNDSRPVGLGYKALKGPSDCAHDSDWMIPLILIHIPLFVSFFFSFTFYLLFFYFFFCFCIFLFLVGALWQSSFD